MVPVIITPSLVSASESKDYAPYTSYFERGKRVGGKDLLLASISKMITDAYWFVLICKPSVDDLRSDPAA